MLQRFYLLPIRFPKIALLLVAVITAVMFGQMVDKLRWETDARVYFPKGHPAIMFDERVADVFGVKDSIIIGIVNEEGIFNEETLKRVERITDKVAALPGVLTQRRLDVASLSSATVFIGTEDTVANEPLMETVPQDEEGLRRLEASVFAHKDLLIGNLVSPDGKATMIRAKLKEGIEHRYQTYFQIQGILQAELGGGDSASWGGGNWPKGGDWPADKSGKTDKDEYQEDGESGKESSSPDWQQDGEWDWSGSVTGRQADNGDIFYVAGRPVIEVTSGLNALEDLQLMIPLLVLAIVTVLFLMFRTLRGVLLPLLVVVVGIVWTMGAMAALGYPMYTISSMLPVILVAVGIGDGIHLLSHYEDIVFDDPHRDRRAIVARLMSELGAPLLITTLTTAVGFLSLLWAEMPPFRIFGVFTALGILFCWVASVVMVPAMLSMMEPHVNGYLKRKRSMRLHEETGLLTRALVNMAQFITSHRKGSALCLVVIVVFAGLGSRLLYVDSSWVGDFNDDSEVTLANNMLNEKFDGTIFLSVVIDGKKEGALKSPQLLAKIDALQQYVEGLDNVGSSLSIVDYLKSTNKTFHAGDEAFNVLPTSRREISEYLFLLSVSGRPEQLDQVIDYAYSQANVTVAIKTDHTQSLLAIIDGTKDFVAREFSNFDVDVNLAGSANNSAVWADLLISSQVISIVLSKLGILVMAAILFGSFVAGLYTVLPVTLTTLVVAGVAGWIGIPLDVSTVLAAGVAIGVGVDYAVHYIFRFARERRRNRTPQQASLGAIRSVGKAIVLNATVVTVGFLVLGLSQFPPHIKLGYFVSSYMVVSCLAALLLLPLAFAWFHPRFSRMAKMARETS